MKSNILEGERTEVPLEWGDDPMRRVRALRTFAFAALSLSEVGDDGNVFDTYEFWEKCAVVITMNGKKHIFLGVPKT